MLRSSFINRNVGEVVSIIGRNVGLATTMENLNEVSNLVTWGSTAASLLDVISSSASDAAAGTGARTVRIIGLDANYSYIEEIVTLNGQTAVSTTKSFLRVFYAEVVTGGTGFVNAGDIYVYRTGTGGTITSGVPGTLTSAFIKVLATFGMGWSGSFTVPAGQQYETKSIAIGGRTQAGELFIMTHSPTDAENGMKTEFVYSIGTSGVGEIDLSKHRIAIAEKTDIYLRGLSSTANGTVTAMLSLLRVK